MVERDGVGLVFTVIALDVFAVFVGDEHHEVARVVTGSSAALLSDCGVALAGRVGDEHTVLELGLAGGEAGEDHDNADDESKILFHFSDPFFEPSQPFRALKAFLLLL